MSLVGRDHTTNPSQQLDLLPHFASLRQRTLQALYGANRVDKSPKGSIDQHILSLVNCINQHDSYVTLSSCSGRIALFDPGLTATARVTVSTNDTSTSTIAKETENDTSDWKTDPLQEQIDRETIANIETRSGTSSGKGAAGRWLLVSHDEIQPDQLLTHFPNQNDTDVGSSTKNCSSKDSSVCSFRFEPLLLHVAASNLATGQILLQIALQCGMRESGLTVTDQRVTVAIRSHSLSLSVPISTAFDHPLRPTLAYLNAISEEANNRIRKNWEKLMRLEMAIQEKLFLQPPEATHYSDSVVSLSSSSTAELPALNLHGQTTIMITTSANERHILAFGGSGPGPNSLLTSPSTRSSFVFCLRQQLNEWEREWSIVRIIEPNLLMFSSGTTVSSTSSIDKKNDCTVWSLSCIDGRHSIEINHTPWHPRHGLTAINMGGTDQSIVLLFGGRLGPNQLITDSLLVFLYDAIKKQGCFGRPSHVQGSPPAPRWGHTFTALYNQHDNHLDRCHIQSTPTPIALLVGGRNDHSTCIANDLDQTHRFAYQHDSTTTSTTSIVSNSPGFYPLYLLSLIHPSSNTTRTGEQGKSHFLWEKVIVDPMGTSLSYRDLCRFHHSTILLDENRIFVLGGSYSVDDLLDSFASANDHLSCTEDALSDTSNAFIVTINAHQLSSNIQNGHNSTTMSQDTCTDESSLNKTDRDNNTRYATLQNVVVSFVLSTHLMGHSICLLSSNESFLVNDTSHDYKLLVSGGATALTGSESNIPTIQFFRLVSRACKKEEESTLSWQLLGPLPSKQQNLEDMGCLIHHNCHTLEKSTGSGGYGVEVPAIVVGGGVAGFAFTHSYAPSVSLNIRLPPFIRGTSAVIQSDTANVITERKCSSSSWISPPESLQSNAQSAIDLSPSVSLSPHHHEQQLCNVLYVHKHNAKTIKTMLEESFWLDKSHRLTSISPDSIILHNVNQIDGQSNNLNDGLKRKEAKTIQQNDCIAVPVVPQCFEWLQHTIDRGNTTQNPMNESKDPKWIAFVVGWGQQACPCSSGVYARGTMPKSS